MVFLGSALRALYGCATTGGGGGCPVLHSKPGPEPTQPTSAGGCPVLKRPATTEGVAAGGSESTKSGGGNAQAVNPLNMMPAPNQQRADGQTAALSTDRVESTIPMGDSDKKWVYPSPQMFYNSLVRKGKGEGVDEASMDSVVAIHNNMNELTWRQVLAWEDRHPECMAPRKLVRFMGRPDELSNKAAAKYYLGLAPRPFDRHDWTVDRCGEHVRYIIDYYDVASQRDNDRMPQLHDVDAVPSIKVDVRPALDSVASLVDRVRDVTAQLPSLASGAAVRASTVPAAEDESAGAAHAALTGSVAGATQAAGRTSAPAGSGLVDADTVRQACAEKMEALQACDSDASCSLAHIALTMCIAEQVCSREASAFKAMRVAPADGQAAAVAAERFSEVQKCVTQWGQAAHTAALQQEGQ